MSITKAIYVSYDFGFRADYENLYRWLDSYKALECGNKVALIKKTFDDDDPELIYDQLKEEISAKIKLEPADRIYVSFSGGNGQLKGKFLFGSRLRAMWEGAAISGSSEEDSF